VRKTVFYMGCGFIASFLLVNLTPFRVRYVITIIPEPFQTLAAFTLLLGVIFRLLDRS